MMYILSTTLCIRALNIFIFIHVSPGKWWLGTDPTALTLKKVPSPTCAPSLSDTVTVSTVKFLLSPSPLPGKFTQPTITASDSYIKSVTKTVEKTLLFIFYIHVFLAVLFLTGKLFVLVIR